MKRYNPKEIEPKWQAIWQETDIYRATDDTKREKYYYLVEFPYPSGDGLHVGHVRSYTALDIMARHKRMQGYNVLYPMGWDAFGLPTENYAIKNKIAPQLATKRNVATFKRQMQSLGFSFDWSREINTTDPSYYKWTQWIFLQLYKAGLAYQDEIAINWCPFEKTGLANEEVVDGKHERCGTPVEKKFLKQWLIRITKYADRLVEDLKTVDYLDRIANQQINWVGKSEGAHVDFVVGKTQNTADTLKFTPQLTKLVMDGSKTNTIRLEAKKLKVGDYAELATRFDPKRVESFTTAKITQLEERKLGEVPLDFDGHESFRSRDEQLADYRRYYGDQVTLDTVVTIYHFELVARRITVFTTRPDTLAGATFLVLAPEHGLVPTLTTDSQRKAVETYVKKTQSESEVTRQETDRTKTGVWTGSYAINPLTGKEVPIWIADYVLMGYGTGAIMAVPAHDGRDLEFARAFDLPVIPVIEPFTGVVQKDPEYRKSIVALVVDRKAGKLLSINWGENGGNLLVGGGLENNEDVVECAEREIEEETGYTNLKFVDKTQTIHHNYFAKSKNVARLIDATGLLFELESDKQIKTKLEANEQGKFKVEWLDFTTADKKIEDALHRFVFEHFIQNKPYTGPGILTNSGQFDGLSTDDSKQAIVKYLFDNGCGRGTTTYKLRDWIFSRQHYWGEPIPMVHCPKCGVVPVPEDQLPIELPKVEHYEPTETGESPLAAITDWVNTTCPKCDGPAKRDTDTMPNWAGSNWYFLRYIDPTNDKVFLDPEKAKYWLQIDLYNGGMEHTTLHLLYSRFIHKFLFDQGLVPTSEPYARRRSHGMIMGPDGAKMSKSKGNVINPDGVVQRYGADILRLYEMFMGPFDEATAWSDERLGGVSRFSYRIWEIAQKLIAAQGQNHDGAFELATERITHKTLKKVHEDIADMHFNTAVSAMMEYVNYLSKAENTAKLVSDQALAQRTARYLILMLAPFTPHLSEELWNDLGQTESVHLQSWPAYDPELIKDELVTVVIQINGKVRANIVMEASVSKEDQEARAKADPTIIRHLAGKTPTKVVVVPRKIVNFVVTGD